MNAELPPSKKRFNRLLDKKLKDLLKTVDTNNVELSCKVIAQAIAWEKVKHRITGDDGEFQPDNL